MFTIDLTLKGTGMALSVQRKEAEAAEALYQQLLKALQAGGAEVVELTCDKQPEKKIAILSSEISAIQLSDKAANANAGRAVSFFGLPKDEE
jgi:Asp-tRNA(Asn)/Glu-tRNA(Gln) amidotransferase A subunit family amidase